MASNFVTACFLVFLFVFERPDAHSQSRGYWDGQHAVARIVRRARSRSSQYDWKSWLVGDQRSHINPYISGCLDSIFSIYAHATSNQPASG